MSQRADRAVFALVVLNVALQAFDGAATYAGLHVGFGEGNRLLASAIAILGPGLALCFAKLGACLCLFGVWRLRHARLALPALVVTAAVYATCSLAPWSAALVQAQLDPVRIAQL